MVKKIIFAIALALVLAGGAGYYWYTKEPICECEFSKKGLKTEREIQLAYFSCTFAHKGAYYPFDCLHKAECFLPYLTYNVANDLQSYTRNFLHRRWNATFVVWYSFKDFELQYLTKSSDSRRQDRANFVDNFNKVFLSHLPCGEDTLKDFKLELLSPLKERGVKMFGRKEYLEMLKTDTNLTNCCNEWKPYFDEIAYHFPHHSHLKIYDLYCIKRDTLLTEC